VGFGLVAAFVPAALIWFSSVLTSFTAVTRGLVFLGNSERQDFLALMQLPPQGMPFLQDFPPLPLADLVAAAKLTSIPSPVKARPNWRPIVLKSICYD
jgi:hypothetical protein